MSTDWLCENERAPRFCWMVFDIREGFRPQLGEWFNIPVRSQGWKTDREVTRSMASMAFIPAGVCSTRIVIQTDGDRIRQVSFEDGCDGNLQAICRLAEGRTIAEIAAMLRGIDCDGRGTSCPDQLARALERIQMPDASSR